jgi:hypothetical protein
VTLPADVPLKSVTGTWLTLDGQPCGGSVTFSPAGGLTRMVDNGSSVVLMPTRTVAKLDQTGSINLQLIATDPPALTFLGNWYWQVGVNLTAADGDRLAPYAFQLFLPTSGPASVNITTAAYAVNGFSVTPPQS